MICSIADAHGKTTLYGSGWRVLDEQSRRRFVALEAAVAGPWRGECDGADQWSGALPPFTAERLIFGTSSRLRPDVCAGRVPGARPKPRRMPRLWPISERWSHRRHGATRSGPCCGRSRSLRTLAGELARQGHEVSHTVVGELLQGMGYRLQANSKTRESAAGTLIATHSFNTSTRRPFPSWRRTKPVDSR